MLELRHLQTLVALAETGRMATAAKRIGVTQSALSHQIKALEDHYGVVFFERKSNPLRWTPVGERMAALAYDVHRAVNEAHRDIARILDGHAGQLRIAVECHSCFDWLMPSMDVFREYWQDVELDLVSGFHPDPTELLAENRADMVIISQVKRRSDIDFHPLFSYHMPVIMGKKHPLTRKKHITAADFAKETLITYPIPDERLDLIRQILGPAKINPERRTAMLTEAILQLVASGRGIAALPAWAIQKYIDTEYVVSRPIGKNGLNCELFAATTVAGSQIAYLVDFIKTMREVCSQKLTAIEMLKAKKQ